MRRWWPVLTLYGVTGVAGCQSLYFVSASRLPVGVAILLEFTGPVLVVGWTRFVRRGPVPRTAAYGVVIALVGLSCVVEVWSGLTLDLWVSSPGSARPPARPPTSSSSTTSARRSTRSR